MTPPNQATETKRLLSIAPAPDDGCKQDNTPTTAPNSPETKK